MSSGVIELDRVTFGYGELAIIDRESVVVPAGGCFVVRGPNGAGKSTLLRVMAGLLPPRDGRVLLGGRRADGVDPTALLDAGVRRGFVFEQGALIGRLTAFENVVLALDYHADNLGLDPAEVQSRARRALSRVGVHSPDMHALPERLSFGTQKRVAFARALAIEPNYVFLDDPDLGLDETSAAVVLDLLADFESDPAITLAVATNSSAVMRRLRTGAVELMGAKLVDSLALAPARPPVFLA